MEKVKEKRKRTAHKQEDDKAIAFSGRDDLRDYAFSMGWKEQKFIPEWMCGLDLEPTDESRLQTAYVFPADDPQAVMDLYDHCRIRVTSRHSASSVLFSGVCRTRREFDTLSQMLQLTG